MIVGLMLKIQMLMADYFYFNGTNRVASGPGISENLEKSGNFAALEKSQGKVMEFHEIRKSQGILMQNWEKSANFTYAKRILTKFFQDSFKW